MAAVHVVVELLQRLLAEDHPAGLRDAVVQALERGPLTEKDQSRCIVREQPHITRVALLLEGRHEPRKVDEGGLERVVQDLSGGDGYGLAAVFRLWAMLHATSRLRGFHLSLWFSMLPPLGSWLWFLLCLLVILLGLHLLGFRLGFRIGFCCGGWL